MDDRGHPSEGGTLTILKGINERMEDDLFLNTEFTTSKRLYAGVQGFTGLDAGPAMLRGGGGRYLPLLGICDPCMAEKAAYSGAAKWESFLASLSMPVDPPGGHPSPLGLGALPGGGYPAFAEGIQSCKRELETSMSQQEPSLKRQVANTTPSSDDNSDGGK